MRISVDLDVHLVKVPSPVAEVLHAADPLPADVVRKRWAEPVPPEAHRLMTDVDATLEEQVLHVPQ